jgi:hypothetical protein
MTNKHLATINKAWFHAGTSGFSPAGIMAKLKNAVKLEIPTGYQDETGFHFGVKAAEKEVQWPGVW